MAKFGQNIKSYNKGILPILGIFSQYEILISLKCVFDFEWNDVINFAVACSVVELLIHRNHKNSAFNVFTSHENISTTVQAMTKSFVPFCPAQNSESNDMNCLGFQGHCENGKILMKHQVYNKGIFTNFG